MIVVSDTSPISALIKINHLYLLSSLFGEVIIPVAVHCELRHAHSELPMWLRIVRATNQREVIAYQALVDPGEAEAIQLAKELQADRLLIDDAKGRQLAEEEGLRAIGLVGVILLAKNEQLIPSVRDLLDRLKSEAHVYLSADLVRLAINAARESE